MSVAAPAMGAQSGPQTSLPEFFLRRLGIAALIGVAVLMLAGAVPAVTALASNVRSSASIAPSYGPPSELRAGAGISGNWEQSYVLAVPSAGDVGAALLAGIDEQRKWDVLKAMHVLADQEAAKEGRIQAAGIPTSLNQASGLAVGTVLTARITIYGCSGPGGGFCGHMSSGIDVFEGAAACSSNLPFGTKLKIEGDPTGRTYECLDRGLLPATWIDVYFNDTSEGIAWASNLGGTRSEITIVN